MGVWIIGALGVQVLAGGGGGEANGNEGGGGGGGVCEWLMLTVHWDLDWGLIISAINFTSAP